MRVGLNGRFLAAPQTGVQRFALEIARRLLPSVDAALLVPRGTRVPADLAQHARVVEGRLRGHAWEQLELPEAARLTGCDATLSLANAVPASGGPHALILHDATVFEHPEWFGARYALWHRRVLLPAARRAAAVGVPSEDVARRLSRLLDRPAEEFIVIPQGAAPLDAAASSESVALVRRRLGLPERYLLATGAGDPRKNAAFLEDVLRRWAANEAPPTLVLVGGGSARVFAGRGRVRSRGSGAGAGEGVVTIQAGRVDDETLRALYTGAAAFCFPSLAEGFGRPPLEAIACGTPAVVAPYGPAREVLGDAAEVVPLDVDTWLGVLRRLVAGGPDEGFEARRHALLARHRWEDGARAALELCERAAAGPGRRARPSAGVRQDASGREAAADGTHGTSRSSAAPPPESA